MEIDILYPNKSAYSLISLYFSDAKALKGAKYITLQPGLLIKAENIANIAIKVFPDAVGIATTKFLLSNNPFFIASS